MKTHPHVRRIRPGLGPLACCAITLYCAIPAIAQVSLNYDLSWTTFSTGGGARASQNASCVDILGQSAPGFSSSLHFGLESGFVPGILFAAETEGEGTPEGEGSPEGEGTPEGEGAPEGEGSPEGEGAPEGEGSPEGEGAPEGEGSPEGEGAPEGEGSPEGEGAPEGEGSPEGEGAPEGEGVSEGEGAPEGEGVPEGEGTEEGEGIEEGEGQAPAVHSADQNADSRISLTELLRVIQFFNSGGFQCAVAPVVSEDGFLPGPGENHACAPHSSDYNPENWAISLTELLRLIQFFNTGGYHPCPEVNTEDGFCPGT